jgi:hypothetical protein
VAQDARERKGSQYLKNFSMLECWEYFVRFIVPFETGSQISKPFAAYRANARDSLIGVNGK